MPGAYQSLIGSRGKPQGRVASFAQTSQCRDGMRTCITLKPIAGGVKNIDAVQDRLRGLKAERLCISQQAGDAEKFASESSDFDLIVSAGGDGTLKEVVDGNAQGGCKAALGVFPLGARNDFARPLGDPTDLETA